jgi:hypothetical protein
LERTDGLETGLARLLALPRLAGQLTVGNPEISSANDATSSSLTIMALKLLTFLASFSKKSCSRAAIAVAVLGARMDLDIQARKQSCQ